MQNKKGGEFFTAFFMFMDQEKNSKLAYKIFL